MFWPVAWNRSGPRTNPYVKFLLNCLACVLTMCQTGGRPLERVQIFILTEGLKIEFFWHYQVEKAVWYKLFANLVYT